LDARAGAFDDDFCFAGSFLMLLLKRNRSDLSTNFMHEGGIFRLSNALIYPSPESSSTTRLASPTFITNIVNQKVDKLEVKVDGIAADLAAHRADTEAHHGLYLVKER
jgi:hypothetical protein